MAGADQGDACPSPRPSIASPSIARASQRIDADSARAGRPYAHCCTSYPRSASQAFLNVKVLVLSDTHIQRRGSRRLPDLVRLAAAEADVIVHAGDIVAPSVLADLADYAPVHAVLGNNDHELVGLLPEQLELHLGGVRVAVLHDSGPSQGRPGRMGRRFRGAAVVVFGHSHLPFSAEGLDGQWLLNPGSCTERRRAPTHTFAWLTIEDDGSWRSDLVDLTD